MSYQPPRDLSYAPTGAQYQMGYGVPPTPPPVPPTGFPGGFSIDGSKQQLFGAIRARQTTDEIIPSIWIIILIILLLIELALVALFFIWTFPEIWDATTSSDVYDILFGLEGVAIMISLMVVSVIFYVLVGILAYKLVKRENEHYQRESQLRMGIISFLRAAAGSPEREAILASEIATMNSIHSQANMSERQREPILWMLAIILGFIFIPIIGIILGLYMFYFLMKTMYEHDCRWNTFAQQTLMAMSKLGYSVSVPLFRPALPNRSFAVYLILTIVTLGLFSLYWLYTLIKDPNDHFQNQWQFEDQLVNSIR